MHQILHEEPPPLSEAGGGLVGPAYDAVVARAIAKRPDARFSSAEEMRDALRDAARRAAESPLATIVRTMVQDVGGRQALAADRGGDPAQPGPFGR
jgi:serine/threonine-protein kinase